TGKFMGQVYEAEEIRVAPDAAAAEIERLAAEGVALVITLAPADTLLAISDAAKPHGMAIFNAQAADDRLRADACRANVLHIAPSRSQMADGLAQYMVWKKWTDWLLVHGSYDADRAMADAFRRAAAKFGAEIVEERVFEDTGGARRSDGGHVMVQKQIPVFMQRAEAHDVVVVADKSEVFGHYLPYRMWDPRPVVGDAGMIAAMWHPAHESWGATQLQRRFEKAAGRRMLDADYLVWLAVRAIGEAVTRSQSAEPEAIRGYLLSDKFQLAGFKGQPLSFRPWTNQLRHGVILGDAKTVVSVSPQEEFLHRVTTLDTLGVDEPESQCRF
ncbi:MAG: ABC transporter substrate-binding protein, partial [Pseudomonadota bacterium]